MNRVLIGLLALVVAGVLAACNGDQASPEAQETAAASPVAQATEEATEEPTPEETAAETEGEGEGASPDPLASFDLNQDQALEELLPDEVGGTELVKFSIAGADAFGGGEEFQGLLDRLGASADDVSAASAGDAAGALDVQIAAFRIAGADTDDLEQEFVRLVEESEAGAVELEERNIEGKDVWTGVDEEQGMGVYFYAAGDVVFLVQTNDEQLAEEAISQLP